MSMVRRLTSKELYAAVYDICIKANTRMRPDVRRALEGALAREKKPAARLALKALLENARIAQKRKYPLCQDTGLPNVFVTLGHDVRFVGGTMTDCVQKAISDAYREGGFRASIVRDPLTRSGPSVYAPGQVYTHLVKGNVVMVEVLIRGFGCENKSVLCMFEPTEDPERVKDFIVDSVLAAGPEACPPFVVGVGIGGTSAETLLRAKKVLLRPLGTHNRSAHVGAWEKDILKRVNRAGCGVLGFSGPTTALAVAIDMAPTHIAGLPVGIAISCHALRSAKKRL